MFWYGLSYFNLSIQYIFISAVILWANEYNKNKLTITFPSDASYTYQSSNIKILFKHQIPFLEGGRHLKIYQTLNTVFYCNFQTPWSLSKIPWTLCIIFSTPFLVFKDVVKHVSCVLYIASLFLSQLSVPFSKFTLYIDVCL